MVIHSIIPTVHPAIAMGQLDSLSLTEIRRDLHRYPESGWKEFRTTALLAEELDERGFDLFFWRRSA